MQLADNIAAELTRLGFAIVPRRHMVELLSFAEGSGWQNVAANWKDLPLDTFMADCGQYRRRRFATFGMQGSRIVRKPHQPHFQGRSFNRLNGGVERWFEPVGSEVAESAVTFGLLSLCRYLFGYTGIIEPMRDQHIELHQFRIEASSDGEGYPTPEGMHRDGVDWACITMIDRNNVDGAETRIADERGRVLATVTLAEPLDTVFFDDRRIRHGVSAIHLTDPDQPGWRDVLVTTGRHVTTSSLASNDVPLLGHESWACPLVSSRNMTRMSLIDTYREKASGERAAAKDASLPNRRQVHERAAATWDRMAQSAQDTFDQSVVNAAAKARP